MSIVAGVCDSYYEECLRGVHRDDDRYMMALYGPSATLSHTTTTYTSDGEIAPTGSYKHGGQALSGFTTGTKGHASYVDWTVDPTWLSVTCEARGALVYNASRGNKACAVLDFGTVVKPVGVPFTVELPPAGPLAVIHILRT